ncbi:fluoride efflux transporter CrcB [Mycetocola lacteus]|uniref:fluoride efflux transporter CrcB n=1 Tax=Mycetocola lacteus TaxID=76637 RepID=UPI001FEC066D|nr:fluoride efflux transporter CrcB [Mycetocola lacteus]
MSAGVFALVILAGGLGGMLRYWLDDRIRARVGTAFPWGILVVNASGAFALGLLTGLLGAWGLDDSVRLILGVGFLGGYTTLSTASVDTVKLIRAGHPGRALINALGSLALGVALAALGYFLGTLAG